MTAISPSNLEHSHINEYYSTGEESLAALSEAMRVEYKAIVDAGFILQIDDPRLATHYDRTPGASIEECRKFMRRRSRRLTMLFEASPRIASGFTPATAPRSRNRVRGDLSIFHVLAYFRVRSRSQ